MKADQTNESRRALLKILPTGVGAAWLSMNWPSIAGAAEHAHLIMSGRGEHKVSHLTPTEALAADAAVAQIIPSDATPGAREAGVIYFIDYCLGAHLLGVDDHFRKGLLSLDEIAHDRFPDAASFAVVSAARQVEVLRSIEHTPFFGQLHLITVVGLLALPSYGGNRDGVGWKLMGFESTHIYVPPFGYYDRDYAGFVPYAEGAKS